MNYLNLYNLIITRCKNRTLSDSTYYEYHHIVPKCLGGTNNKNNIVKVTAKEHIFLHLLLAKEYPNNYKLLYAANCMVSFNGIGKEQIERKEAINTFSIRTISKLREDFKTSLKINGILDKNGNRIFIAKKAICFDENHKVIKTYYPTNQCIDDNFFATSVNRACRGKENFGHKYAGYYWMYEKEFIDTYGDDELNIYYSNLQNGVIPKLDTEYNNLSYKDKLKLRQKPVMTEELKRKISMSTKGKTKTITKEKKAIGREKAKLTHIKNNTFAGRPKTPVIAPDGVKYDSLSSCGKQYGVDRNTIKNWINNHPEKGFRFL